MPELPSLFPSHKHGVTPEKLDLPPSPQPIPKSYFAFSFYTIGILLLISAFAIVFIYRRRLMRMFNRRSFQRVSTEGYDMDEFDVERDAELSKFLDEP